MPANKEKNKTHMSSLQKDSSTKTKREVLKPLLTSNWGKRI
jgi:hypothetical protein